MCFFKPVVFYSLKYCFRSCFYRKSILVFSALFFCFHPVLAADNTSLAQRIVSLAPEGCVVLFDEHGKELFSYNQDKTFVPASIIKILTALAAIELLGEAYRFKTEFHVDRNQNLAIKGWGDPFLISEEIDLIMEKLKTKGLTNIREIYLDNSAFTDNLEIAGTSRTLNPYDALNGALVVNFNTLNIGKDDRGVVYSAEKATPLTPLAIKKGKRLKAGGELRINLTDRKLESLQYAGELFIEFAQKHGIVVKNRSISHITVDQSWQLFHTHFNSRDVTFILKGLLKYSNNFIANQVFLVIGSKQNGYPATLEKSRSVFEEYLQRKLGPDSGDLIVDEASGISKNNRMTGRQMIVILKAFRAYRNLLPLKNGIRLKSGTLTGVYNYAGFFETLEGPKPFVIMMNQKWNNRDKILKLLRKISVKPAGL